MRCLVRRIPPPTPRYCQGAAFFCTCILPVVPSVSVVLSTPYGISPIVLCAASSAEFLRQLRDTVKVPHSLTSVLRTPYRMAPIILRASYGVCLYHPSRYQPSFTQPHQPLSLNHTSLSHSTFSIPPASGADGRGWWEQGQQRQVEEAKAEAERHKEEAMAANRRIKELEEHT
eukprot:2232072-Rhodomonas_salina.2